MFEEPFRIWKEAPDEQMRDRLLAVVAKIKMLRDADLSGQMLIAEWVTRGIVPLRSRPLRMWEMTPDLAPFVGTAVTPTLLTVEEIEGTVIFLSGASFSFPTAGSVPAALPDDGTRGLVSCSVFL